MIIRDTSMKVGIKINLQSTILILMELQTRKSLAMQENMYP